MNRMLIFWGLILVVCASLSPVSLAAEPRLVSTSANGEVEATPDIAIVQGRVVEERQDADEAVRLVQKKLDGLIGYLQGRNIATADIRAAQILVDPKWHYPRNQPRQLTGYEARGEFTVKVRNVALLARLFGGLVDAGASELQPTRFDFSNREELELQAIAEAVRQARAKAVAALAPLGATVGDIHNLGVNTQWQQPPVMRHDGAALMSMAKAADAAPQINIGNHTISANVNASFRIH